MMDLGKYIFELLQSHECVVLPGFGGFITRNEGASIHPVQNLFTPPTRKVVFNEQLVNNDGLLARYIADIEHVDYDVALQSLMFHINELLFTLYKKQEIELNRIGKIVLTGETLQFKSEIGLNIQEENYGLPSFIMPLIQRERNNQSKPVEPVFVEEVPKRPIGRYVGIAASIVVLLGCFSWFLIFQPHSDFNVSSLCPEFHSWFENITEKKVESPIPVITDNQPTVAPAVLLDSLIAKARQEEMFMAERVEKEVVYKDVMTEEPEQTAELEKEPIIEPVAEVEKPQESIPVSTKKYYVIGASYELRKNAEERCEKVKALGFQAEVLDAPKIGRFRVSYGCCSTREESETLLEKVRQSYRSDAWLLIVK